MLFKLVLLVSLLGAGFLAWQLTCSPRGAPPQLDLRAWWGPEAKRGERDEGNKPFRVRFSDEIVQDLRQRLTQSRPLHPSLEGTTLEYGIGSQVTPALNYWREKYNFTARERFLNQYPQFTTTVQGLKIHYIRVKPQVKPGTPVVPLLLLHGWPGSVREFYEAIPLLAAQREGYDFAMELIIPSLPGFGYSEGAVRPGFGPAEMTVVIRNLMHKLGFKQYYVQGGDAGAMVASIMTSLFPEDLLGHHNNMGLLMSKSASMWQFLGSIFPPLVVDSNLAERMYPLTKTYSYLIRESGYMHIQATKPDTVGVALSDSPAGLAAYILEKFAVWTFRDASSMPAWLSLDGMIDNLMIYWTSNSITTSMRLYSETFTQKQLAYELDEYPTNVPTWIVQAKNELTYLPPSILKLKFKNLINSVVLDKGGHFLAFELPELFADDVWTAMKAFREWNKPNVKTEL